MFWFIFPVILAVYIFIFWFFTRKQESGRRFFFVVLSSIFLCSFIIFTLPDKMPSCKDIEKIEINIKSVKASKGKIPDRQYYTLLNDLEAERDKRASKRKRAVRKFNFWYVLPWNR